MRILSGIEARNAEFFFNEALKLCESSYCLSSQCGSVIVKNGLIIGSGTNSPPGHVKIDKCLKDDLSENFRSDRTCCVHAEERAILDALALDKSMLAGSTLFFIRKKAGQKVFAGNPIARFAPSSH